MKSAHIIFCLSILLSLPSIAAKESSIDNTQAIVLAAGGSTRFKTDITKLRFPICGQAMVLYPIKIIAELQIPITVVIGFQKELVQNIIHQANIPNITFVEQKERRGTGHAVACTKSVWHADNILIINGDMPPVTSNIITKLCKSHQKNRAIISFVVAKSDDPNCTYGRIVNDDHHIKIVEAKHFTASIYDHPLTNAGIYLVNRTWENVVW